MKDDELKSLAVWLALNDEGRIKQPNPTLVNPDFVIDGVREVVFDDVADMLIVHAMDELGEGFIWRFNHGAVFASLEFGVGDPRGLVRGDVSVR